MTQVPTFETIDYSVENGIGEVLLDRPDVLNAFNNQLMEELASALYDAHTRDSVYVIILSGKGRAFCSGVDTNQTLGPASERDLIYNYLRGSRNRLVFKLLYEGQKPVIAAINGPALGGGFDMAIACDLRIMSENAWMRDQHVNLGIPAGAVGGWILPTIIGESKAKELVYTSEDITAEKANDVGLLVDVVDEGEALDAARELATQLRDKPAQGLQATKEMFSTPLSSLTEAYELGSEFHWACIKDPEHQEALDAAMDGREPEFGRDY